MPRPIAIVGAGDHARVIWAAARALKLEVLGWIGQPSRQQAGDPTLLDDGWWHRYRPDDVDLVNGIGSIGVIDRRRTVFEDGKKNGWRFLTLVHPAAYVSEDAVLGEGSQVMAGAVVQSGARIGENVLINTGAIVEHDCAIGDHCHVASGAVLSGAVTIGPAAHIGAGATVKQYIRIGSRSVVGAGAVIVTDVKDEATVVGVPGRELRRKPSA